MNLIETNATLNCKGRLLLLDKPVVMGILNATPDSFFNKGIASSPQQLADTAQQMLSDGATILDIGGLSTRPGSEAISIQEEIDRVVPVIELVRKSDMDAYLSIDTYHAKVAAAAVAAGADIVNDVSAGEMDSEMLATVAQLNVPYIAMHMQGRPKTMQQEPIYEHVVKEVIDYFIQKIKQCADAGIKDVIIDPGFGFGKNMEHNYLLLHHLDMFKIMGKPVLAGFSRKSMINRLLNTKPETALNGTTILNTLALQKGAKILRVHDVKEAAQVIEVYNYMAILPQ